MSYNNKTGRITVDLNVNGTEDHNYGHGVRLSMQDGWNDNCETLEWSCSVEDLRDLNYLLTRAIAAAEAGKR